MLLSDAIIKFFPEMAKPNLIRKKSKAHWRRVRNKTKKEKAATILTDKSRTIICRQLIHGTEDFPILDITDDEISICITKQYDTLEIDISNEDLLAHDIEIIGEYCEENLMFLIDSLIDRIANLKQ